MLSPVLQTKITIPPISELHIPRSNLVNHLEQGLKLGHRLFLIYAPPGYGKTTLVREWLDGENFRLGWFSLDEGDNDPAQFWNYLANALTKFIPNLAETIQTFLQNDLLHQLPGDILTTTFINSIAQEKTPLLLVLDDYHVIHNERIHAILIQLLSRAPNLFHLVITSRNEPPLELHRLRARGQITEIGMGDLSFSETETDAYLNSAMKLDLSKQQISTLAQRTEGWPAALQLAALALQSIHQKKGADTEEFIEVFGGSHRYVSDFLTDEVFKLQEKSIQSFLLETSLLEKLSEPLCDHLLCQEKSQMILEKLEQSNLFLLPLDATRQWYRYHTLWAETLRARLKREYPDKVSDLHQRAYEWFSEHGFIEEAINHAIAADNAERAADLIEGICRNLVLQGGSATLQVWLSRLPYEIVNNRPILLVAQCWAFITDGKIDDVEVLITKINEMDELSPTLLGEIAAIRAITATIRQDLASIHQYAKEALRLIPMEDSSIRCGVLLSQGTAAALSGDIELAIELLNQTIVESQRGNQPIINLIATSTLAQTYEAMGQFPEAEQLHRKVIAYEENPTLSNLPLIGVGYVGLGGVLHEYLKYDEAEAALLKGLEIGKRWGSPEIQIGAYISLARLKFTQGKLDDALAHLDKLEKEFAEMMPIFENGFFHSIRARIHLATGQFALAEAWESKYVPTDITSITFDNESLWLVQARILLARRENEQAEQIINHVEAVTQAEHLINLIETLLLKIQLPTIETNDKEAILMKALRMAEPNHLRRVFVDEQNLLPILQNYCTRHPGDIFAASLLIALEKRAATQNSTSILSEREMEVLHLLSIGLSNQEIADHLVVALSTVKSHVKSILMKLEAENRTSAVARARELKLLV